MTTPREEGEEAGRNGLDENDDNPYEYGTAAWGEWRSGWLDGDTERFESNDDD